MRLIALFIISCLYSCAGKRYQSYDFIIRGFAEVPSISIDLKPQSDTFVEPDSAEPSDTDIPDNYEFVSKKLDSIILSPKATVVRGAELGFWGFTARYGNSKPASSTASAVTENQIHYASGLASFSYYDQNYTGFSSSREFTTTYRIKSGADAGEENTVTERQALSFHETTLKKRGLQIILNPTFNYFTLEAISGDVKPQVSSLGTLIMLSAEELIIESFPNDLLSYLDAQDKLPENFSQSTAGLGFGFGGSYVWDNGNSLSLATLTSNSQVVSGDRKQLKRTLLDGKGDKETTLKTVTQFGLLFPSKNGFFWGLKLIGDSTQLPRDDFNMEVTSTLTQLYMGYGS